MCGGSIFSKCPTPPWPFSRTEALGRSEADKICVWVVKVIVEKSNASINCEIVTYILVAPHCQQSPMIWVREGQQVQVQSRGSPVRSPACPTTPPAAGINEISTFDFFICSRAIHHNQGRVCGPFPHTHIPPPAQGERNKLRPEICFSAFPLPWEFALTNSLAICFLQMVVRKRTDNFL